MSIQLLYLDRLRALAVISVIVVHTAQFSFANLAVETGVQSAVFTILSAGRFGVEVFFLLSGFLLSHLYEGEAKKTTGQYFLARFLRIWPLWIVFTGVWTFIYFFARQDLAVPQESDWIVIGVVLSAFFLLWASPAHFDSFIGGAWSIQIEVVCYLLFAWLRGRSTRVILTLAVLVNVIGVSLALTGDLQGLSLVDALRRLTLQSGINFFIMGWLFARVYGHSKKPDGKSAKVDVKSLRESFQHVFSGHEWLVVIWVGSFLFAPAIYGNSFEAVGFVCIAIVLAQLCVKFSRISRLLERVGKVSYFMFFMHFVLLHFLNIAVPVSVRPDSLGQILFANLLVGGSVFGLSLLPAIFSLKFFERPLMQMAKKG
jgi:peptidoglycan/LPS O-acetylase OafA/YrhL